MNAAEVDQLVDGVYKLIYTSGKEVLASIGSLLPPHAVRGGPTKWFAPSNISIVSVFGGGSWAGVEKSILLASNDEVATADDLATVKRVTDFHHIQSTTSMLMESHQKLMEIYQQSIEESKKAQSAGGQTQRDCEILEFRLKFLINALNCIDDRTLTNIHFCNFVRKIEFGYEFSTGFISRHCMLPTHVTSYLQSGDIKICVVGYNHESNIQCTCYLDQVYPLSYVNDDKAK